MEWEEFRDKVKSLHQSMRNMDDCIRIQEYVGFDEMERYSNWYLLFIALSKFIEDET